MRKKDAREKALAEACTAAVEAIATIMKDFNLPDVDRLKLMTFLFAATATAIGTKGSRFTPTKARKLFVQMVSSARHQLDGLLQGRAP